MRAHSLSLLFALALAGCQAALCARELKDQPLETTITGTVTLLAVDYIEKPPSTLVQLHTEDGTWDLEADSNSVFELTRPEMALAPQVTVTGIQIAPNTLLVKTLRAAGTRH